jgi:tyrosyl-tRNA synthetase
MEKGDGMSFAEFTYPLLQGWDWWHMFQKHGVQVQIGGSDQYGNIIAGIDGVKYIAQSGADGHISKEWLDADGKLKEDMSPMGLTVPLLTTPSGEKFGKSAGNAIWLDKTMTSAFDLYGVSCIWICPTGTVKIDMAIQFLLRSSDEDVARYLKLFTFVPSQEIAAVMAEHAADPGKRKAQHLLACEVLELVHGREEALKTKQEHQSLRNPSIAALSQRPDGDGQEGQDKTPRTVLPASLVLKTPFSRILYHAGIVPSKSEGARLIAKGGAYIGSAEPAGEAGEELDKLTFVQLRDQNPEQVAQFILKGMLIFRIGKWKTRIVEVVEDADFEARELDAPGWEQFKALQSL